MDTQYSLSELAAFFGDTPADISEGGGGVYICKMEDGQGFGLLFSFSAIEREGCVSLCYGDKVVTQLELCNISRIFVRDGMLCVQLEGKPQKTVYLKKQKQLGILTGFQL